MSGGLEPRPVECILGFHRARFYGIFTPGGIFKMPSGALCRENHGRWTPFHISIGRGRKKYRRKCLPLCSKVSQNMNYTGIIIGLGTFLIIGIFHPIVIKAEYYFGKRCWWAFLLVGAACMNRRSGSPEAGSRATRSGSGSQDKRFILSMGNGFPWSSVLSRRNVRNPIFS